MVMVIKQYRNKKLYNTRTSQYVSLAEIACLVQSAVDVLVIDNKTKRDVTREILAKVNGGAE